MRVYLMIWKLQFVSDQLSRGYMHFENKIHILIISSKTQVEKENISIFLKSFISE